MKKYIIIFILSILFSGVNAQSRIFLKYDGIDGSSVVSGYEKHVEIYNLSYNINNLITTNSTLSNPLVSQPSKPGLITFYNQIEASSPAVLGKFFEKYAFSKIEIKMTKGSGPLVKYCTIELNDAIIASVQSVGENQEKIQILAAKIKVIYTPYDAMQQAQTPVVRGWNYSTNTANN
jgi:type VI protein secretion system component Hcp